MPIDPVQQDRQSGLTEEYLKSVSLTQLKDRAYTPYEMEKYERDSIEDIKSGLKKGKYKNTSAIQESLNFLEKLANKINIASANERKDNKTTWELDADLVDIKKLFDQLDQLLQSLETKESADEMKKPKKRMVLRK